MIDVLNIVLTASITSLSGVALLVASEIVKSFGSLFMLAMMASAFMLVTWVATFILQESTIR
jgi:hypothetical protein